MQFAYKRFFKSKTMQYQVVDVIIPAGQSGFTVTENLEDGKVVKAAFFTDSTPNKTVSLAVYDNNNKAIHPPVHFKEFVPTNGNHLESRKQLEFTAGRKIKVSASSDGNLAAEFKGQLLLYIEEIKENNL